MLQRFSLSDIKLDLKFVYVKFPDKSLWAPHTLGRYIKVQTQLMSVPERVI